MLAERVQNIQITANAKIALDNLSKFLKKDPASCTIDKKVLWDLATGLIAEAKHRDEFKAVIEDIGKVLTIEKEDSLFNDAITSLCSNIRIHFKLSEDQDSDVLSQRATILSATVPEPSISTELKFDSILERANPLYSELFSAQLDRMQCLASSQIINKDELVLDQARAVALTLPKLVASIPESDFFSDLHQCINQLNERVIGTSLSFFAPKDGDIFDGKSMCPGHGSKTSDFDGTTIRGVTILGISGINPVQIIRQAAVLDVKISPNTFSEITKSQGDPLYFQNSLDLKAYGDNSPVAHSLRQLNAFYKLGDTDRFLSCFANVFSQDLMRTIHSWATATYSDKNARLAAASESTANYERFFNNIIMQRFPNYYIIIPMRRARFEGLKHSEVGDARGSFVEKIHSWAVINSTLDRVIFAAKVETGKL